jgi:hypothetical protein
VWEGVIGYIDAASVDQSLAFMVRAGGPGTRLALTLIHRDVRRAVQVALGVLLRGADVDQRTPQAPLLPPTIRPGIRSSLS